MAESSQQKASRETPVVTPSDDETGATDVQATEGQEPDRVDGDEQPVEAEQVADQPAAEGEAAEEREAPTAPPAPPAPAPVEDPGLGSPMAPRANVFGPAA